MVSVASFGRSTRRALVVLLAAGLSLVAMAALTAAPALAATTLNVSTTADSSQSAGACATASIKTPPSPLSLREAVCLANNIGGEVNINIPAGEYKLSNGELLAGLAAGDTVNFTGAGAATTIINGQGQSRVLNFDNNLTGSVNSTITGLTIKNGAANSVGGAGILAGDGGKHGANDVLILKSVVVRGNVANGGARSATNQPGGGVQMSDGQLTIENSTIAENTSYGSNGGGVSYINEGSTPNQSVLIKNTTIEANQQISSDPTSPFGGAGVTLEAASGEINIVESRFVNNAASATSTGGSKGAAILATKTTTVNVSKSVFTGNSASGGGGTPTGSVFFVGNSGAKGPIGFHFNRMAGNTPVAGAVTNENPETTLNASENWWGCNGGPNAAGCEGTSSSPATAILTSTPYLKFNASASPSTVAGPNGTSTVSAGFLTDSAGTAVSAANLGAFSGANVTWKEPTPSPATINGSTTPSTTALSAGIATAIYNSQTAAAGAGHATAAFDNASQTVNITIDQKPAVTENPASQMVNPGATATFKAAASGTPTPTVQWERSTNGGSTFTPIPGATSTTYSFTAASGETGYQFRAVFTNTIEGTPYTATTTAATLTVGKATTTLSSTATSTTLGGAVKDTATLGGGVSPGGNLVFNAYGPNDATCTGAVAFTKTVAVSGNGSYGSTEFTATAAGDYRWTIAYSGDANNEAATSACNAANEKSTVAKKGTTLTTTATSAAAPGPISDSGTLAGATNPTGTITFRAYGPGNTTCTGGAAFTGPATVTANGTYGSGNFSPPSAGEYRWTAEYSGDANNEASSSACGAVNETSTVTKVLPTLSTTATSAEIGQAIHDTATLAGGVTPGGSVTFSAFGPGDATCASTAAFSEPVTVTGNGTYSSPDFTPANAGTYTWKVVYSGDGNNQAVTSPCGASNETSQVTEAAPTISTTATSATLGGTIHDTATIAGGVSPGGIVTFKAFGPNDSGCTKGPVFSKFVAVSGNKSYDSTNFTPTAAGAYNWVAEYSGDGNNEGVISTCEAAGETSTVAKASPTISTKATDNTVGSAIHDTATLAGGVTPGGSITFSAFGPNDATCANTAAFSKPVTVTANGEYKSPDFTPAASGTYRWTAEYSGESNNNAVASKCNDSGETSHVTNATPTLSTKATDAAIGGAIHDTATLAGGVSPGGTITFSAFGPGDATCARTAAFSEPVTVTANGEYKSPDFTPITAGSYSWTAEYSGDAGNEAVASSCGDAGETSTVSQAAPTISTIATSAKIGVPVHDTATIAGGHSAGGNIVFKAFGPNDATCIGTVATEATVAVSGDGQYGSGDFSATELGEYRWTAEYSGDTNNKAVASACGAVGEISTISQAEPTIATSATSATVGGAIHDTATIAAGHNAGGSIVFEAFAPTDPTCTGAAVFTATVAVNGNAAYGSGDFTPTALGAYHWTAAYSGDTDNKAVASACGASEETSTITQAEPTLSASATPTAAIGSPIHDTATIAGGSNAGGTVTFEAFGPNDATCSGPAAFTKTVTVSGDGSYGSTDFTPAIAGEYRWTVAYSGDTDNKAAAVACNATNQTSVVAEAAPTLVTSATDAVLGGAVHDTATLAGGQGPTGTITFKAFAAGNTTCTGAPVFTKTVTVAGNGAYGSADYTPSAVGAYRWIASYSGDANNTPAEGQCGDAGETSTVSPVPPPPVVPPAPNPPVTPAPPALCTPPPSATANGYVPTKKVTTGLVPGVRARIAVAESSNLQIAATLKYNLNGKSHSAALGSALLENPGARNLRLALPTSLRESLPIGTKVRLLLQVAVAPVAGAPCAAPQHRKLSFKTKVVQVLVQQPAS